MKRKVLITAALVAALALALLPMRKRIISSLSNYLTVSKKADADLLLVEGWVSDSSIAVAAREYRSNGYKMIVTTGIYSSDEFFNLHSNGWLIFSTTGKLNNLSGAGSHSIEVEAYSQLEGEERAHFVVYLNDKPAGDFYAELKSDRYRVNWDGDTGSLDSVSVRFDNDKLGTAGDRNLYVRKIIIDGKTAIPYLNNSVYDRLTDNGHIRLVNNIESRAENARNRLIQTGIDPAVITAVPAREVWLNRTLTSALTFRDWFNREAPVIKGINIVSEGSHTRRTWMTYNKILHNKYPIGILAVTDTGFITTGSRKTLKTLREALGLIYYRLILIPLAAF